MNNITLRTIGTYNVLHPYPQNQFNFLPNQGKDWNSRVQQIADNILDSGVHVLCVQELSKENFEDLKKRLSFSYAGFHTKHDGGNQPKKDGVAIFYKPISFALKAVKTCTKTERSTTARRDLYVDLEDLTTHTVIRCASAHIEGNPAQPKLGDEQLSDILSYISRDYPGQSYRVNEIFLGCDLNQTRDIGIRVALAEEHGFTTTRNHIETEIGKNRQIDWVFFKTFNPNVALNSQSQALAQTPASDHRLVSVSVQSVKKQEEIEKEQVEEPKLPQPQVVQLPQQPIQQPQPIQPLPQPIQQPKLELPVQQPFAMPFQPVPMQATRWEKFTNSLADIFSRKNAKWWVPASILSVGLIPLGIVLWLAAKSIFAH